MPAKTTSINATGWAEDRKRNLMSAAGLLALLIGAPVCLTLFSGAPRLPGRLPSWLEVAVVLQGPELPLAALGYLATTIAWLLWAWLAISVVLQIAALIAESVSSGRWVRPLRATADRVAAPIVRQLVQSLFVAVFVVQLAGRVPVASAASPSSPVAAAVQPADAGAASAAPADQQKDRNTVDYTVQRGDTVWGISERFYDTGWEYQRVVSANVGRRMADGRRFTDAGHIYPGWVLQVPLPSTAAEQVDGEVFYTVEPGDTLSGIAARLLGDENRWHEIFTLNDGVARVDGTRVLHRANVIWPGLRLKLPLPAATTAPPPAPPAGVAEQPPAEIAPATVPTAPIATPTIEEPAATPATSAPVAQAVAGPSALQMGLGALGGVAAAAGVVGLARRRFRRSMDEPPISIEPESDVVIADGFAEVDVARAFSHRAEGSEVDPVVLLAEQTLRYFDGRAADDISLVMARHGRSTMMLTLDAGPPEQALIIQHAPEFGTLLGGTAQASRTADRDVQLKVSGVKLMKLMNLGRSETGRLRLLPLGVLGNRELLDANWQQLGHVLVAGEPGGGADVVLTSVLAALASRVRPDELQLVTIAAPRTIPDQLGALPHQRHAFVDTQDQDGVRSTLSSVRDEVIRRMRRGSGELAATDPPPPELLVVISEMADVTGDDTSLELIGKEGPGVGVRLLAATTRPGALENDLLRHFGTRLVLRLREEEQSVRLVGRPDAFLLDGGGDMLIHIQGRDPVQVRGYRLTAERLDELLTLMAEAFGRRTVRKEQPDATDSPAVAIEERVVEDVAPPEADDVDFGEPVTAEGGEPGSPVVQLALEASAADVPAPDGALEQPDSTDPLLAPRPTLATIMQRVRADMVGTQDAPDEDAVHPRAGDRIRVIAASQAALQVRCFGGFRVTAGEAELSPLGADGYNQYKPWELLAFLAAQRPGPVPREIVTTALWPKMDEEGGAGSLRAATKRLRSLITSQLRGLDPTFLQRTRDGGCQLDSAVVWSDVQQFLQLTSEAHQTSPAKAKEAAEAAQALYRGDLLTGTSYKWIHERGNGGLTLQEEYREKYRKVTMRLGALHCDEGRPDLAVTVFRRLLDEEPVLEDVVRRLYHCYQLLGDRVAIVREHKRLQESLRKSFADPEGPNDDADLYQPSAETVAAYAEALAELDVTTQSASVG